MITFRCQADDGIEVCQRETARLEGGHSSILRTTPTTNGDRGWYMVTSARALRTPSGLINAATNRGRSADIQINVSDTMVSLSAFFFFQFACSTNKKDIYI